MLTALRNLFFRPRKPVIEVHLKPATGAGSAYIEVWVFPLDPSADPARPYIKQTSDLIEASWITEYSAYFEDRWAAEITGILTPGRRSRPPAAWDTDTALNEAKKFLAMDLDGADIWVLEHTSKAPGVRAHHATGTIELPFDIPVNVDTYGPMEAAQQWLLEQKRSFLESRPPEHCLRKALPQGPEAVMEALQTIQWSPAEVEHARRALIYMALPARGEKSRECNALWYSERSEQENWLRENGHYRAKESWEAVWVPNEEFNSVFTAICQTIPKELLTPAFFSNVVHNIRISRTVLLWLAFHSPEEFWETNTSFWRRLGRHWKPRNKWVNATIHTGFISLTEKINPSYNHQFALDVFAKLPHEKQLKALEQALEDMIAKVEDDPYERKEGNVHLLQPLVPDWPYWELVKEGLKNPSMCASIRSRYREQQLQDSLPEVNGTLKKQRF